MNWMTEFNIDERNKKLKETDNHYVLIKLKTLNYSDIFDYLKNLQNNLNEWMKEFENDYEEIFLDTSYNRYKDEDSYLLMGVRKETEKETKERILKNQKQLIEEKKEEVTKVENKIRKLKEELKKIKDSCEVHNFNVEYTESLAYEFTPVKKCTICDHTSKDLTEEEKITLYKNWVKDIKEDTPSQDEIERNKNGFNV